MTKVPTTLLTLSAALLIGCTQADGQASPVNSASNPPQPPEVVADPNIFGPFYVLFEADTSLLTEENEQLLNAVATAFFNCNSPEIVLKGHTDRVGSQEYNLARSTRMADSVAEYLIGKGLPADKIYKVAMGEEQPVVPTEDGVSEPQNRRVEITTR